MVQRRKGESRRRDSLFTKQNGLGGKREYPDEVESQWLPRQNAKTFGKLVVPDFQGNYTVPDSHHQTGSAKVLRPASESQQTPQFPTPPPGFHDSFVVDRCKLIECINSLFQQHDCLNANFAFLNEIKKGCTARVSFQCTNCQFKSGLFPLYTTVDKPGPGAKQAGVNLGLQVGLQETSLGNSKLRVLLSGGSIYSPSRAAMQNCANRVADKTTELNKSDMHARLVDLKDIQKLRGVKDPSAINIAFDGRYDSTTYTARHKCGQSCSQVVGVAREQTTGINQVVGLSILNKLCHAGQLLKSQGQTVSCPGGHEGCTANIRPTDTITERKLAHGIGLDIKQAGLTVSRMTTDGDATSATGVADAFADTSRGPEIIRQADTVHRGQQIIRYCQNATFSKDMFPPKKNDLTKTIMKKHFAVDMKNRTSLVMTKLFKKYNGDFQKISQKLHVTVEAIILCYSGICRRCRYQTTGCGGGKKNSWWSRSTELKALGWNSGSLTISPNDELILRAILELKLSDSALREMPFLSNTNACEGFNRSISSRLPKNVTFSRNGPGRVHATAHSINNKLGQSLIRKVEHLGSHVGPVATKALQEHERRNEYLVEFKKQNKAEMLKNKSNQLHAYIKSKIGTTATGADNYKKGTLEPKPRIQPARGHRRRHSEHPYCAVDGKMARKKTTPSTAVITRSVSIHCKIAIGL